jgi:hypothetical protein
MGLPPSRDDIVTSHEFGGGGDRRFADGPLKYQLA